MKAFHQGGTASSKAALVDQFGQVQDLLLFPKILPGSATLSTVSGKETKLEKDTAGGHNVFIEGERHYIPQSRGVPVYDKKQLVVGTEVKKGMPISEAIAGFNTSNPELFERLGRVTESGYWRH